jgi:5-methylcytosine-specific restriction endonuclease McrA
MERITRKAAKAAGLKHYFTGKPCKRSGHIDRRYVAQFTCVTCAREKAKETWDKRDADKRKQRSVYERQRWKNPEFRDRQREYARGAEERIKKSIRNREWKKANRARCTDRQNKRHAALQAVFVEDVSLAELFERDNGRCKLCGCELSMTTKWPHPKTPTRDHVIPLSKGGTHERSNLQLACAECNVRKGNRCA